MHLEAIHFTPLLGGHVHLEEVPRYQCGELDTFKQRPWLRCVCYLDGRPMILGPLKGLCTSVVTKIFRELRRHIKHHPYGTLDLWDKGRNTLQEQ